MSDDTSGRLAEKMLQGWTLLAVNCPEPHCCTPLVSSKKDKTRVLCVKCDKWYSTEPPAQPELPHTPQPVQQEVKSDANEIDPSYEARRKRRDATSNKLGEKMLQGWALMNQVCPKADCGTPFVRNREGKLYCVTCDQFAMTEEQVAATAPPPPSGQTPKRQEVVVSPSSPQSHAQAFIDTSGNDGNEEDTYARALHVLHEKLAAAVNTMEGATTDSQVKAQCKVIRDLVKTIKAIQAMH
ncbi:hypothetical protein Ae201684P_007103 [Aphanomyces euteiches]|uniref:Sjoegren syndrome/scleroderma autoantigen 1 n=1 Tax=Aphanomyces euteiches TaxID=100861 RepID=A0A6G0X910_9STRA|nr:hypothetical protein Ae201684_007530 [Aphanomyces euteiches]KAH9100912.1 hypothetical protein Ae201684P_007103 [Aphanomyces euteiches]